MVKFRIQPPDLAELIATPEETKGYLFFEWHDDGFEYRSFAETGTAQHLLEGWNERDRILRAEIINGSLAGRLVVPYHRRRNLAMRGEDVATIAQLCRSSSYSNSPYAQLFGREKEPLQGGWLEWLLGKLTHAHAGTTTGWLAWYSLISGEGIAFYEMESFVLRGRLAGGGFGIGEEPLCVIRVVEPHAVLPAR